MIDPKRVGETTIQVHLCFCVPIFSNDLLIYEFLVSKYVQAAYLKVGWRVIAMAARPEKDVPHF